MASNDLRERIARAIAKAQGAKTWQLYAGEADAVLAELAPDLATPETQRALIAQARKDGREDALRELAGPVLPLPNRLPDVDASDPPAHWYHKGWNDCRDNCIARSHAAPQPQPQASAEDVDWVRYAVDDFSGRAEPHWPEVEAAWQRIRADYERMGVVK